MAESSSSSSIRFTSEVETGELENYRPINKLAAVAFIASLAASVSLVHHLLWPATMIATVLSIASLIAIRRGGPEQGGRLLASAALAISLILATYTPVRAWTRQNAIYRHGQVFMTAWIELLREGRDLEAHQLSVNVADRYAGEGTLEDYYAGLIQSEDYHQSDDESVRELMQSQANPQGLLQGFHEEEGVKRLLAMRGAFHHEHLENIEQGYEAGVLRVGQRYRILPDNGDPPFVLKLTSTRMEVDRTADWEIDEIAVEDL